MDLVDVSLISGVFNVLAHLDYCSVVEIGPLFVLVLGGFFKLLPHDPRLAECLCKLSDSLLVLAAFMELSDVSADFDPRLKPLALTLHC